MKKAFTDQMQRSVDTPFPPRRIVSLVPSQTELLYYLGLSDEVVGQTLFCIHPQHMHQSKPRVGGTKKLNMEKIAALQPDLIIGNKEENEKAQVEALEKQYPVWMSDIRNLDDALQMMQLTGELVNRSEAAQNLVQQLRDDFTSLPLPAKRLRTLYLIWRQPWMAAGADTFINDMLGHCGFDNVCEAGSRYPQLDDAQLKALQPELILLSSEPYPFAQKHMAELQALYPQAIILLVDGELFSWYGSRLLHSVAYFKKLTAALASMPPAHTQTFI